jgi:hypothetical protein
MLNCAKTGGVFMDINQRRIDRLNDFYQTARLFGRKPHGCYLMRDAVRLLQDNADLVIATVAWWDDLPAGFTWCEVLANTPRDGHYHVRQATEPKERENWIPESEAVAVYWRNVHVGFES